MNSDIFTSSNKSNQPDNPFKEDNNFFLKRDTLSLHSKEPSRHLNDYDSNILKEDAYKDVNDDILKLEYKIAKAEKDIKDIDNQIIASKEILDFSTAEVLFERRKKVQEELRNLFEMYSNACLSAKISSNLTTKIRKKIDPFKNIIENVRKKILGILPGKLSALFEIKNSLIKLENINRSVDELIALKIPYGESSAKYEQLSKYIVKANSIQSDISRHFKA